MGQLSYPLGVNPIPGYRFLVSLNAALMGFQKVSGMNREIETEIYKEGGLNTKVHVFPRYCSGEGVLRLEKGIYGGVGHPFYLVGEEISGVLDLIVMDNFGKPLKSYLFAGMIVKRWEVAELSAEQSSVLIDHFEISYEEFHVAL